MSFGRSPTGRRSESVPRHASSSHVSYTEWNPVTGAPSSPKALETPGRVPIFSSARNQPTVSLTRGRSKSVKHLETCDALGKQFDSGPGTPRSPTEHKGSNLARKTNPKKYETQLAAGTCAVSPDPAPRKLRKDYKKDLVSVNLFSQDEQSVRNEKARELHFQLTRKNVPAPKGKEFVQRNSRVVLHKSNVESTEEAKPVKSLTTVPSAPQDSGSVPVGGALIVDKSVPSPSIAKFKGIRKQPSQAVLTGTHVKHVLNPEAPESAAAATADPSPSPSKNFSSPHKLADTFSAFSFKSQADVNAEKASGVAAPADSTPSTPRRQLAISKNQHLMSTTADNGVANPLFHSPVVDTRPQRSKKAVDSTIAVASAKSSPIKQEAVVVAQPETSRGEVGVTTKSSKSYNIITGGEQPTPVRRGSTSAVYALAAAAAAAEKDGTSTPARRNSMSAAYNAATPVRRGSISAAYAAAAAAPTTPRFAARPLSASGGNIFGWGGNFE